MNLEGPFLIFEDFACFIKKMLILRVFDTSGYFPNNDILVKTPCAVVTEINVPSFSPILHTLCKVFRFGKREEASLQSTVDYGFDNPQTIIIIID